MRISDWSSDVCSSDLGGLLDDGVAHRFTPADRAGPVVDCSADRVFVLMGRRGRRQSGSSAHHAVGAAIDAGCIDRADDICIQWMADALAAARLHLRSEEHTSELQSLMRISYAVFCLKKKKTF